MPNWPIEPSESAVDAAQVHTIDVGHVITKHDPDTYACGCGERFPTWFEARDHMTEEHGWPEPMCDVAGCEQTFPTTAACFEHERSHVNG